MSAPAVLKSIIRPALRLCLRRMLKLQDFVEYSKEVIVDLAREELEKHGRKVTVSAVCVMTGIHRREVTRLLQKESKDVDKSNLAMRVINRWQTDSNFLTQSNSPRVLSYAIDFHELVSRESKDINPKTLVFELERVGAIEVKNNKVKLLTKELYVQDDPFDGVALLSEDLELLTESVEENVYEDHKPKNHHMHTVYDNIFEEDIPRVRSWFYEEGAHFHAKLRDFLGTLDKDINPKREDKGGGLVKFCSFSWTSQPNTEDSSQED